MVKVKDIFEQNQDLKETTFIHLEKAKEDPYDPLVEPLWDGWLKNIPVEFMEYEVKRTGKSLRDLENGIVGFCIEIKAGDSKCDKR